MNPTRFVTELTLVASLATLCGCGWQRTMRFPSPSGRNAVEVWQVRFANEWGTKIDVVTSTGKTELDRIRRDAIIYFVHVYWSPDENRVGIFASGFNFSGVGYDIARGKSIPFERIKKELGESIAQTYRIPPGEDPMAWAASAESGIAFAKLHPEIRLSYTH